MNGCASRRALAVLCVIALAGCATGRPSHRDLGTVAYEPYLRGLMLERSSSLREALEAYHEALEHDRRSPRVHIRMGATYLKLGAPDKALRAFTKALELDPHHPEALRWIGMLYTSQGNVDRAIEAYNRLLQAEPENQMALSTLADLYVL